MSKFSQISSTEPKLDTLEMFYREFICLKIPETKKEKTNHKFTVLNNASDLYNNELTLKYKKICEREPKDDKSCGWKQKYSPTNLKVYTINLLN